MRPWAGPISFLGATASRAYWLAVPFVASGDNPYVHAGNEAFFVVFAVLSLAGMAGAAMAGTSARLAPALLAVAIVPSIGALLLPGLLVIVATLLALEAPEPGGSQRRIG